MTSGPGRYEPSRTSALYFALVLAGVLAGAAYKLRAEYIFSCQADGYDSDRYLSYCQAPGYGDYEHGAFWYGLEGAAPHLANAEALFLGDSRMEVAFSTQATADWFSSESIPYYLLGFGYRGNAVFARELLRKYEPRPKIYVISLDGFFGNGATEPAAAVMWERRARIRYELKQVAQVFHRWICGPLPALCGNHYVIFRSRATGAFHPESLDGFTSSPVSDGPPIDARVIERSAADGKTFLDGVPIAHECVIFTIVPTVATERAMAKAVADTLDIPLIAPELAGLVTFDGSHLNAESAQRWSSEFLRDAGPRIRSCLGRSP